MYQEFDAGSDLLVWPLVGLLIFFAVFMGVLAYAFFGLRDRRTIDELSALPLAEDDATDAQTEGRAS